MKGLEESFTASDLLDEGQGRQQHFVPFTSALDEHRAGQLVHILHCLRKKSSVKKRNAHAVSHFAPERHKAQQQKVPAVEFETNL